MLCVLTTDAVADAAALDTALREATRVTLDRVDTDGCMSTNDTVLLLASGASGVTLPQPSEFAGAPSTSVLADLAGQLIADAEGASKQRRPSRWSGRRHRGRGGRGRPQHRAFGPAQVRACTATTPTGAGCLPLPAPPQAAFDPLTLDVAINGVMICRDSAPGEPRELVDLSGPDVSITARPEGRPGRGDDLTTDLTVAYVHENSAYST